MSAARQPSMRSPAGVAWGSVLVCMRRYRVERDTPVLALTCRRRKILSVSLSTIDMTLPLKVVLAGIGRNMRGIQAAIVVDTQTRPVDGKPRLELSGASRLCDSAGNYGQTRAMPVLSSLGPLRCALLPRLDHKRWPPTGKANLACDDFHQVARETSAFRPGRDSADSEAVPIPASPFG
jgi:hypothetical protein